MQYKKILSSAAKVINYKVLIAISLRFYIGFNGEKKDYFYIILLSRQLKL